MIFFFSANNLIDNISGNSHKNGTDSSVNHSSLDTDEDMGMLCEMKTILIILSNKY